MILLPWMAAATVGKVIYDVNKSDKLDKQANEVSKEALSRTGEAKLAQKNAANTMNNAVLKLMKRKKAIMVTTMKQFVDLYKIIIQIELTDSDGIRELHTFSPTEIAELHSEIIVAEKMPPQPKISGNVVMGYLMGGLFGAISSSMVDESRRNLDNAYLQSKRADMMVLQSENICLAYEAITQRAAYMTDVITKLNLLFVQGLQVSAALIEKNGSDKKKYSREERKTIAACCNLASAIKDIIDVPLIDEEGEITKYSLEVIQQGEKHLRDTAFVI